MECFIIVLNHIPIGLSHPFHHSFYETAIVNTMMNDRENIPVPRPENSSRFSARSITMNQKGKRIDNVYSSSCLACNTYGGQPPWEGDRIMIMHAV